MTNFYRLRIQTSISYEIFTPISQTDLDLLIGPSYDKVTSAVEFKAVNKRAVLPSSFTQKEVHGKYDHVVNRSV